MKDDELKIENHINMKKIKFTGKLSLNKETIARLDDQQMNAINGGYYKTDEPACNQVTTDCQPATITCNALTEHRCVIRTYTCNVTLGC